MAAPEHNIDYYILGDDGSLIDARGAKILAVDAETDYEDVLELVEYNYDDLDTDAIIPALKYLPKVSAKPVDVAELLTNLAGDPRYVLSEAERQALIALRDELPEVYR